MIFTETYHCRSHAHCKTCRDEHGGKVWRANVGAPEQCPQGHPWGFVPDGIVVVPPPTKPKRDEFDELAEERRAICKWGMPINGNCCQHFDYQPGLGRCKLEHPDETAACPCAAWYREPGSRCPMGKW